MKSFQERLLKDFDVRQEQGQDGKIKNVYVYIGDFAVYDHPESAAGNKKRMLFLFLITAALYVICIVLPTQTNAAHITGGLSLLGAVFLMGVLVGMLELYTIKPKEKMPLRDFTNARGLILWFSILYVLSTGMCAIGNIWSLIQNGADVAGIFCVFGYLVCTLLMLFVWKMMLKISWHKIENPEKKMAEQRREKTAQNN